MAFTPPVGLPSSALSVVPPAAGVISFWSAGCESLELEQPASDPIRIVTNAKVIHFFMLPDLKDRRYS